MTEPELREWAKDRHPSDHFDAFNLESVAQAVRDVLAHLDEARSRATGQYSYRTLRDGLELRDDGTQIEFRTRSSVGERWSAWNLWAVYGRCQLSWISKEIVQALLYPGRELHSCALPGYARCDGECPPQCPRYSK